MYKKRIILLLLIVTIICLGTPNKTFAATKEVQKIVLNEAKIELDMSGTNAKTLKATIYPSDATNRSISWSSSDKKVAEVDANGKITAKANGMSTITAKSNNGKKASCVVSVKTLPKQVALNKTSLDLECGTNTALIANLQPSSVTDGNVEWKNSTPSVVAIERPIEQGIYYIKTALNENKVIDINQGSKENNAKVQIWNKNNSEAQQFEIISSGDGYYTIKAKHSGKALEVAGAKKEKGTLVQQYNSNGSDAQKWKFEFVGNGYYYIKSKCNGLYLDVKGGKSDNGTQMEVWTENLSNAQKFKLEEIKKTEKTVQGIYYIKTALNENKVIDINQSSKENKAKVQIWNKNNSDAQKFEIIHIEGNNYVIRAKHSGKILDVAGAKKEKGTLVQQYSLNGSDAQIWIFESAGNGYYYIKSKCNGLYLDVKGGKSDNGTQIEVWTKNSSDAQKFKLEKIDEKINDNIDMVHIRTKKAGKTTITTKIDNGKTSKCEVNVKKEKITGGQAIAQAAVKLACTVAPTDSRLKVEWASTRKYNDKTKEYINAQEKLIKYKYYASCDAATATAVRYSGVDKNMAFDTTIKIWKYFPSQYSANNTVKNGWKKIGTFERGKDSISKLQPGDVLLSGTPDYAHIWIYTGNEAVKMKYPNSNADGYEAGYNESKGESYYPHLFNVNTDSRNKIKYYIFRNINSGNKIYDKIL